MNLAEKVKAFLKDNPFKKYIRPYASGEEYWSDINANVVGYYVEPPFLSSSLDEYTSFDENSVKRDFHAYMREYFGVVRLYFEHYNRTEIAEGELVIALHPGSQSIEFFVNDTARMPIVTYEYSE